MQSYTEFVSVVEKTFRNCFLKSMLIRVIDDISLLKKRKMKSIVMIIIAFLLKMKSFIYLFIYLAK